MNPHERKRAQEAFRTGAQVCVATEAAGEGINLQFCHLMINFDMPWNPTRLEQRLGRIHRIGQERDCYALLKEYEEATGIALARSHVDFSAFQRRNLEVEERRLMEDS